MAPAQTVFSRLNRRLRRALKARMGAASTPRKLEPKRAGVVAGAVARVSKGALMASSSVGLALAAGAFAFPDAAHAQAVMRGVERLPGGKWTGAKAPTVAVTNTGFRTTIEQTQQKALLDWRRFNIQNGDEVYFNQEAADWIAFNRIWDTDPTLIDGKITARGQVYLMNTNGLIFGENARINVNTLLATSNLLTEEQFEAGIGDRRSTSEGSPTGAQFNDFIGNPENRRMDVVTDAGADGEFGTGDDVVTDFGFTRIADPAQRFSAYLEQSRVTVREGARIVAGADVRNVASTDANGNTVFTPQIAEGAGTPGKIMLFGTNVSNAGVLDAGVNGQVFLAAGERTYLLPSLEPSFRRGFDVEVSPATTRARAGVGDFINRINNGVNSVAANTGEIVARQGNITMVGTDVEQLGDVTATTSGVLNGLIELRATTGVTEATGGSNPLARARGGRVLLGEGSVTAVLPEEGGQRVAAGQDVPQSEITLNGRTILLETGSAAVAPGGVVNAVANAYGDGLTERANGVFNILFNTPRNKGEGTLGDIIIESGAVIDVSGIDGLQLSVADLIAPVDVESNELANVPAQQDGVLDGQVVFVDITRGSRVVDWTGALGTRLLSTQERSLEGGAINLISNGTVIVDKGATLDISGGSIDYQSGFVRTTRLRLADGRTVDISAASPTARYTSVLLSDPYFVEGFTEGFDAGSLRVLAPGIYLGGDLRAGVTPGERQLRFDGAGGRLPFTPPDPVGLALNDDGTIAADSVLQPVNMLPRGGSIRIGETDFQTFSGFQTKNIRITADFEGFDVEEAADIVEFLIDAEFPSDDILRALANTPGFSFDSDLASNGFITDDFISNSGAASLFVGNALIFDDRSFVVDDNASLTLAGAGALTFVTSVRDERVIDIGDNFSVRAPGGAVTISEVDFGDGLVIDVSGGWFNELSPGGDPFAMPFIDGGDIILTNALFEGAATLNVSGGARNRVVGAVGPDGRAPLEQDFGRAGSITFGETPGGRDGAFTVEQFDGLNVLVAGFAGAGSVSFSLSGSDIVISDDFVAEEDREEGVLYFTDDILNGIGAAEISFELVGDILISSGVDLTLQQQTLVLNEGFETIATGADLLAVGTPSILGRRERIDLYGNDNPGALIATNLRFAQQPAGASSFTFEEGARIALDPGSSVVVEGQGLVRIAGVIETPGGSIQIGSGDTVWLDDSARLIARGFAETFRDPARQIRRADLLSGGDITVSAPVVVTQAGSVIDVSGADPVEVDILTRLRGGVFMRRAGRVGGDAGTITLTSVNGGFIAGSLLGAPGREGARGGTLTIRGGGDAEAVPVSEAQLETFLEDLFAGAYGYEDTLNQYFKATYENGETGYEFRYENAVVGPFGEDNATIDAILDVLYAGQGPFEALPTPVTERTGTRRFLAFFPGSYTYDSFGSDISEETDAELLTQILLSSLPAVDGGGLRLTDGDPLPADLTPEGLDAFFNQAPTSLDDIIANIGAPEAGLYEIQNSQQAFANTVAVLLRAADPDTAAPSAGLQVDANSFQGNFDTLTFNGDLNTASDLTISARRQINLPGTILGTSANLTIKAPYVTWGGQTSILRADSVLGSGIPESRQLFEENGVLTVNADHVDFTGVVRGTRRFSEIVVNSRGDIRAIDFGRDVPAAGFPEGEILSARTDDLEPGGGLRAEAPIVMNAGQIYPGSSTDMVISSATSVTIGQSRSRRLNGPALSAGGTLEISAPLIEQGGTLRAPQGAITFNGDNVRLLADSVTSASLEGLLIPYGVVVQNDNWFRDTTAAGDPVAGGESIDTPPQRSIVFGAQDVTVEQGAVVNVSGGGDVIARQFVSGPEGSVDIIRQNDQAFAIVPVFGNNVAAPIAPGTLIPLDSFRTPGATIAGELQPGGVTAPFGLEVTLAGGNGIAPGTYTVLPAEYAIVPGAYLVEPVEGDTPSTSFTSTLFDGSAYMAGRFSVSGTPIADALPQTFRVSTFSQLNDRAEYSVFGANSFFTSDPFVLRQVQRGIEPDLGVRTPADGGRFAFDLTGSLNIEPGASVLSGGVEGARGGLGDIVSNRVAVISDPQTPEEEAERDRLLAEGFLVLTTADVESIGAGSLLIGGVRRQTAEGTLFDVSQGAETVIVDTSAADPLAGEEVLLIARDSVTIRENSVIAASGAPVADASTRILGLTDVGDVRVVSIERQPENLSAFVQVSSAASGDISRQLSPFEGRVGTDDGVTVRTVLTSDAQGDVIVEAGARLEAAGAETIRSSIILDGSRDVQFQETPGAADGVQILADRFVAGASAVNLGDAGRPLSGLTLSQASLTSLSETIDDLALTSRTSINVFGDVSFSVAEALRFDADEIVADAASNGSLDITAGSAAFVSSLPAAQDAAPGTGTGALTVTITGDSNADLVFGDGEKSFAGFASYNFSVAGQTIFEGANSANTFDADATFAAQRFAVRRGSAASLDVDGALSFETAQASDFAGLAALPVLTDIENVGASLQATADDIFVNAGFQTRSGALSFRATGGDVTLGSGAVLDATGQAIQFYDVLEAFDAGSVSLVAEQGDVVIAEGARIDVSGDAQGGDAGVVVVEAANGAASLGGVFTGTASDGFEGGSFALTAAGGQAGFSAVNALLEAGGFNNERRFRFTSGDVTVTTDIAVNALEVVADAGDIIIGNGAAPVRIETTGDEGGDIRFVAGGDLIVRSGAAIDASAKGEGDFDGGRIELAIDDADLADRIVVENGAAFNVAGSGEGRGGVVYVRAPQLSGGDLVAVAEFGADVAGGPTVLEAYRSYEDVSTVDGAFIATAEADAAAFMSAGNLTAIYDRLGRAGDLGFQVWAGIEARSSGDMTFVGETLTLADINGTAVNDAGQEIADDAGLTTAWNLADLRYDDPRAGATSRAAGALTLRAGGALAVDGNISDGFIDPVRTSDWTSGGPAAPELTNDASWNIDLVAGADLGSADARNVSAASDDGVTLGRFVQGALVRTGTGDIGVYAAGDVELASQSSVIYTAGTQSAAVANFEAPTSNRAGESFVAYYPENGGDITIDAGGDILGAVSTDTIAYRDWLIMRGAVFAGVLGNPNPLFNTGQPSDYSADAPFLISNNGTPDDPSDDFIQQTSASIAYDEFRQGIAAFGDGDIDIDAGGDIDTLGVSIAQTTRIAGGTEDMRQKTAVHNGRGDMRVSAGGDIRGSSFWVGDGTMDVTAAGAIGNSERALGREGVSIFVGDAQASVTAGGALQLRAISSATTASAGLTNISNPQEGLFRDRRTFGGERFATWVDYSTETEVVVTSLGGDVTLQNQDALEFEEESDAYTHLPGRTTFRAPNGSMTFGDTRTVDAHQDTALQVFARDDVDFLAPFFLGDADFNVFPRAANPLNGFFSSLPVSLVTSPNAFVQEDPTLQPFNIAINEHQITGGVYENSSSLNRIYTLDGGILINVRDNIGFAEDKSRIPLGVVMRNESRFIAGDDIVINGTLTIQNNDPDDLSLLRAGDDIVFPSNVENFSLDPIGLLLLWGPGHTVVEAGDNVIFGRTPPSNFELGDIPLLGIHAPDRVPVGSNGLPLNPYLDRAGTDMDVTVLSGVDQDPEVQSFLGVYVLDPASAPDYLRQVSDAVLGIEELRVLRNAELEDTDGDGQTTDVTIYAVDLVNFIRDLNGEEELPVRNDNNAPLSRAEQLALVSEEEYAAALVAFDALDPELQRVFAYDVMFSELRIRGREAVGVSLDTDPNLTREGDPTAGYDAIAALFPGAQRRPEEPREEGEALWRGDIIMQDATIRTEGGGDINILAPGGRVQQTPQNFSQSEPPGDLFGGNTIEPTDPATSGIVTLTDGAINALTSGNYDVNSSRTLTVFGGDILVWSSYGDIDAGRGRRDVFSAPPVEAFTDLDGVTTIGVAAVPFGSGIGALSLADGSPGGDVDLYAFNGVVDAGDAGIRANTIVIGALQVLGLDNIAGEILTNVDIDLGEGDLGPLNLQNFAQEAIDRALEDALTVADQLEESRTRRTTILTGELLGIEDAGGDDDQGGE